MKNSLIYLYIREDRMDEWEMFVRGVCLSTDRRWFYKEEYCHRITCTILLVIPGGVSPSTRRFTHIVCACVLFSTAKRIKTKMEA